MFESIFLGIREKNFQKKIQWEQVPRLSLYYPPLGGSHTLGFVFNSEMKHTRLSVTPRPNEVHSTL